MKDLHEPIYKTYGPEGEVKTKEELLETLRSLLDAGNGFAFSAVINMEGQACMVQSAGGSLSIDMAACLIKDTVLFLKKITKESSIVEACQCPKCRGKNEKEKPGSTQYH